MYRSPLQILVFLTILLADALSVGRCLGQQESDVLYHENLRLRVGIDRSKGGAITFLGTLAHRQNMVNVADPGRLIQQSYYAGKVLDRSADGQHPSWSPWAWNPIQGGGVGKPKTSSAGSQLKSSKGSWAGVLEFQKKNGVLYSESIPKLWDMPNEDASARMRQWTQFEEGFDNVVVVRCEFTATRTKDDRWGPALVRSQEVPACYFTREYDDVMSYTGNGNWHPETKGFGKPWNKVEPPRKTVGLFDSDGHGIALFSPSSDAPWNFGPHGPAIESGPNDGPCMHVAAISRVALGPRSRLVYRYWLIVGDRQEIADSVDRLWERYKKEQLSLTTPKDS